MLKAVSKHVLQPFAGELRPVFSTVKGLRNPLYIYFFLPNRAVYLSIRMVSKRVKNQSDVKLGIAQHSLS